MTRQFIAPDATMVHVRRAPLWVRVMQTMRAAIALTDKGHPNFLASHVVGEIDERMSQNTIYPALNALCDKGLLGHDGKRTYRWYHIVDRARFTKVFAALSREDETIVQAFRYDAPRDDGALPVGAQRVIDPTPVARSHMGWWGRTRRIEQRLIDLERKINRLLALWEDDE